MITYLSFVLPTNQGLFAFGLMDASIESLNRQFVVLVSTSFMCCQKPLGCKTDFGVIAGFGQKMMQPISIDQWMMRARIWQGVVFPLEWSIFCVPSSDRLVNPPQTCSAPLMLLIPNPAYSATLNTPISPLNVHCDPMRSLSQSGPKVTLMRALSDDHWWFWKIMSFSRCCFPRSKMSFQPFFGLNCW